MSYSLICLVAVRSTAVSLMLGVTTHPALRKETAVLDTLPRPGALLQTLPGAAGALPSARTAAPEPPDPAVFADAVARYHAPPVPEKVRAALFGGSDSPPSAPLAARGSAVG